MRETYRPFGIAVTMGKWGKGEAEWYHQNAQGNRKKKETRSNLYNVKVEGE